MTPDNQLARGIQSKSIWVLRADTTVGGVGGQAPHKAGGLGMQSLPNIKKILICLSPLVKDISISPES